MEYEVFQMDAATWRIENKGVRFFVLAGSRRAAVIDTGMSVENAKDIAASLTDQPLMLINTHADMDHTSGNNAFETAHMHPAEYVNYFKGGAKHPTPTPLWDGEIIDLGGRTLRVITQPGHTPGSIALLDQERRVLYAGDSIQDGRIFMFGPMRNLVAYRQSLEKIMRLAERFDLIYPCHASLPLTNEIIPRLMEGADRILRGEATFTLTSMHGTQVRVYDVGAATFLCDSQPGD